MNEQKFSRIRNSNIEVQGGKGIIRLAAITCVFM